MMSLGSKKELTEAIRNRYLKANKAGKGHILDEFIAATAHSDVNSAANIFERYANVSPLKRSSGRVASPVVVSLRNNWHTVYALDAPI